MKNMPLLGLFVVLCAKSTINIAGEGDVTSKVHPVVLASSTTNSFSESSSERFFSTKNTVTSGCDSSPSSTSCTNLLSTGLCLEKEVDLKKVLSNSPYPQGLQEIAENIQLWSRTERRLNKLMMPLVNKICSTRPTNARGRELRLLAKMYKQSLKGLRILSEGNVDVMEDDFGIYMCDIRLAIPFLRKELSKYKRFGLTPIYAGITIKDLIKSQNEFTSCLEWQQYDLASTMPAIYEVLYASQYAPTSPEKFEVDLKESVEITTGYPLKIEETARIGAYKKLSICQKNIIKKMSVLIEPYSTYYTSDTRTGIYLDQAKSILKECREKNDRGEIISKNQLNLIEDLQRLAAYECAQWIVPTFKTLKSKFDQEKNLQKHFSWNVMQSDEVPVVVKENLFLTGATVQYIDFTKRPFNIKSAEIQMYPMWEGEGSHLVDKDIMRWFLYHESSHLLAGDLLYRSMEGPSSEKGNKLSAHQDEVNTQQELHADIYAYNHSRSACVGGIKHFAGCVELERTKNLVKEELDGYPSYSERLALALKYAKEHWGISQEECQKYVLEGRRIFKEKIKKS